VSLVRVQVETRRPYEVLVGPGALDRAPELVPEGRRAVVVTDRNVAPLHGARLPFPAMAIEPGEGSKSLAVLEEVLEFLASADLDRSATVLALGGGVVGDLAGLAASLFMRGIDVVQCPTTLLAQVDAAVGGKTAVNLTEGKNLAGTFHQPRAVLADVTTLDTLPEAELRAGLGEVVKSALVADPGLLALLEESAPTLVDRDPGLLTEVVARCVRVKADVVGRDEREAGARKALNLGHTFGHALERAAGLGTVPHGEAVGVGLVLAAETAVRTGIAAEPGLPGRLARLLEALGLAHSLDDLRARYERALEPDEVVRAMRHDKKGAPGDPAFVLPVAPGHLSLDVTVEAEVLRSVLAAG
jgi:3-dehydroquinate synthase